jgi:hypothetical protein
MLTVRYVSNQDRGHCGCAGQGCGCSKSSGQLGAVIGAGSAIPIFDDTSGVMGFNDQPIDTQPFYPGDNLGHDANIFGGGPTPTYMTPDSGGPYGTPTEEINPVGPVSFLPPPTPIPISADVPPERPGYITGEVRDSNGNPVPYAQVDAITNATNNAPADAIPPNLRNYHTTADEKGGYRLAVESGYPHGYYIVRASSNGLNFADAWAYLWGQITVNVDLTATNSSQRHPLPPVYDPPIFAVDHPPPPDPAIDVDVVNGGGTVLPIPSTVGIPTSADGLPTRDPRSLGNDAPPVITLGGITPVDTGTIQTPPITSGPEAGTSNIDPAASPATTSTTTTAAPAADTITIFGHAIPTNYLIYGAVGLGIVGLVIAGSSTEDGRHK